MTQSSYKFAKHILEDTSAFLLILVLVVALEWAIYFSSQWDFVSEYAVFALKLAKIVLLFLDVVLFSYHVIGSSAIFIHDRFLDDLERIKSSRAARGRKK